MSNIERAIKALEGQEVNFELTVPRYNRKIKRTFVGTITSVKENLFTIEEEVWCDAKIILVVPYLGVDSVNLVNAGPVSATIFMHILEDDEIGFFEEE